MHQDWQYQHSLFIIKIAIEQWRTQSWGYWNCRQVSGRYFWVILSVKSIVESIVESIFESIVESIVECVSGIWNVLTRSLTLFKNTIKSHSRTSLPPATTTSHQQTLPPHSVIPIAPRHEQDHGYPVYPHLQHRHACSDRR